MMLRRCLFRFPTIIMYLCSTPGHFVTQLELSLMHDKREGFSIIMYKHDIIKEGKRSRFINRYLDVYKRP